jgi:hypothetical protein
VEWRPHDLSAPATVEDGRAKAEADVGRRGGEGRNRTGDTTVFSRVLYQLSYLAAGRLV